jgi:hypothetical protein
MSAPTATNHGAALDRLACAMVRALVSAAESQQAAVTTDSAGACRPLGTGDRSTMHEDRTCALQEAGAAFEEDGPRELTTPDA